MDMARLIKEEQDIIDNFSSKLDEFIKINNYTNESFGSLIGVSEASVRKYRKGEILPSHTQMKKILNLMHIRYHKLLGFVDPEVDLKDE